MSKDSETVYYRITRGGRTALIAKDDKDAIAKAKVFDDKWSTKDYPGTETTRIVKSVNTVIWRKEQ